MPTSHKIGTTQRTKAINFEIRRYKSCGLYRHKRSCCRAKRKMSRALIFLVICALPCRKIEWGRVVVAHRKTSPSPPFCSQKIKWFKLSKPQYGRARASRITRKKMFVGKGNVRWVFIASLLRQSCVHKVDEISFVFPQDR